MNQHRFHAVNQNGTRFSPKWFASRLSAVYRHIEYSASVGLGWRAPLIPPDWLDPGGRRERFTITGEEFLRYFVELCGLKPGERVLDVGCGTGRMAHALTGYLEGGSYDGIDIVAASVRWCQKSYRRQHPSFRFHHADLYNKEYNPAGKRKASEYRFPFETSSFDFVFLTSVFTHMLRGDVNNYLSEIARVLKPTGRCLITYFLLNTDSRKLIEAGASRYDFRHELPGCRVQSDDVPEAVVAYSESEIRELYLRHRLLISEPIRYGKWCGRERGLSMQDILIAEKPRLVEVR